MKGKIICQLMLLSIFIIPINIFCVSGNINNNKQAKEEVRKAFDEDVENMVNRLNSMNNVSPSTFSISFVIIGNIKNKKFKSIGNIDYNGKLNVMYAAFLDYIFKSPVTYIYKKGYDLNLYFPAENKLVLDDIRSIDLRNYLEISLDFNILYDLLCGKIPLLENYKIKQGLSVKGGKGSYLILENDQYYETISYSTLMPDKILILKKNSKEKFEIYIKEYEEKNQTRYFKNIRILVKNSDLELDFSFEDIKLNIPVNVKTMNDVRLPAGVKLIKM